MEAILGIVVGFLGPAIELGKCIAEPIKRQFNYLCCFNNNVQNLEDEAQKLEAARYGLEMKVNTEQNNAQVVVPQVSSWLEKVSEIQKKKPGIDNEITTTRNGGSTVGSRFSLSKKVKKMAEAMKELRQSGNFNTVSHPPPPAALASIRLRSTFEFDSRKRIEDEIMVSLRDEKVNMLGICGMGGVGKTTMATTIMHRARKELGFEETVMAVVSQKVDMLTIQNDIAKSLGLKLEEGSLSSKAHDLRTRLTAGTKRSLIVLDDVWENLKLEDLGIPCQVGGCKVVLTSRDSAILKQMYVEKVHGVQVLSKTEAWDLFISNVGSCIEQENVGFVARQVVDECKGLPIALVTVGVALKDMANISHWNIALSQLKSCNPTYMREVLKCVYQPLKLSYDLLETDEKSLILLCCLFPEDDDIPLETLAIYAMGLHMYKDITSLERARDTTCFLVERLKSRFLLLEGYDENHVKMHDVVRDVAIFIASEEKRINCNGCTWISPNIGEKTGLHVGSAVFPNLHLLLIDRESRDKELAIDDDFFEGMSELNVFSIECPSLQRLPQTIELLKNLKTLVLESCGSLESISVVGELVNLEILICRGCKTIESLPVEIGRVSRLRLLELSYCENLKTIAPGIISNLIGLEELIVEDFDGWEGRIMKEERKNASLSELEHLSSLTRLKIKIKDCSLAAEQIRLSPKVVKCDITFGDVRHFYLLSIFEIKFGHFYSSNIFKTKDFWDFYSKKFEKTMRLELPRDITLGKWIHECVRSVEYMSLRGDGSRILDLRLAQNMRRLAFGKCSTVKKLVNTATLSPLLEDLWLEELTELEEICPYQQNLVSISIIRCGRLRSLFSLSVMESGCFLQLEWLLIHDCEMMEQAFLWNGEEENQTNIHTTLVFPKLKFLSLKSLPRLTSLCKGIESIEFPLLQGMSIVKCPLLKGFVSSGSPDDHDFGDNDSMHFFCKPNEVIFGCLSKLVVHHVNDKMRRNWCPQIPIDCFVGLRELEVSGFEDMKSLFSLSMTARGSCINVQLERLEIRKCDMMEQVLLWNEEDDDGTKSHITLAFPNLKFMCLQSLPRLTSFCKGIKSIEFSLLNKMHVSDCPLLKGFVSTGSPDDHDYADNDSIHFFCKPNEVKFGRLSKLNVEMERNLCPQIPIDFFAGLSELNVSRFEGLKSLFSFSMTESRCLLQLEKLVICRCDMMEQVILWKEEEIQTDIHITLFPKLKFLSLDSLPRLTSLIKGIESIQFIVPDRMRISNCPLLESCVSTTSPTGSPHDNDDSIHLLCKPHKVEFDSLKELELKIGGYDNMRRNWCPQIPIIDLFARLCKLQVRHLKGMESLFPCSIARILRNIRSLGICRCEEMVKVIEDDASGGETETTPPIRLFPNLEDLSLIHLPKLKSFCEWRCALQLPSLYCLRITNCDLMEELTSGPLNTPNLKYLLIDDHNFSVKDVKSALQLNRLRREEERKTLLEKSSAETKEKEIEEIEM